MFQCPICSKDFSWPGSLRRHIEIKHDSPTEKLTMNKDRASGADKVDIFDSYNSNKFESSEKDPANSDIDKDSDSYRNSSLAKPSETNEVDIFGSYHIDGHKSNHDDGNSMKSCLLYTSPSPRDS